MGNLLSALLIRVAADQSSGGGSWNGPVDADTNEFAYVAIPEYNSVHPGLEKPYSALASTLSKFHTALPGHLSSTHMHLDPDFSRLTYGDSGRKARQIRRTINAGDFVVFYAGLRDIHRAPQLVYAIIGVLEVDSVIAATSVPFDRRDINAHSRRILEPTAVDVILVGKRGSSGRLRTCIPIGEYRDRAYRVRPDLLDEWGGLSVSNGYLQRSAQIPSFLQPTRFLAWFKRQSPVLLQLNN